jgi:hypothetical protein
MNRPRWVRGSAPASSAWRGNPIERNDQVIRNLKALGLALVAMFAFSAFVASAAQATGEGEITSAGGTYPLILSAETNVSEKFTAFGKEVTCNENFYEASVGGASTEVTIEAEYNVCHVPGPLGITLPATVTMNTCDIVLYHATTDLADPTGNSWNLTTEIGCEDPDDVIEIHVYANQSGHTNNTPICTITVTQQTVANGPTATNNANGTVTLSGQVTGLHAESHNSSSLCPEGSGTKTTTTAVQDLATGGVEIEGETEGGAANAFHIK